MTREMNKPDWCKNKTMCGWWQTGIEGVCDKCLDYKPKQRVLNPLIAEFFERCCKMERLK